MRVTVIIPTYNRSALLREAVRSVAAQNIPLCEVIICDDGSTEDFSDVVKSATANCQVIWSRTNAQHGAQVARNRGLSRTRGEAVLFLDSDDVLVTGGLECLVRCLEASPSIDYAYGTVVKTDGKLKVLAQDAVVGRTFDGSVVEVAGYHWHTMGALYRTRYARGVGGWNEALSGAQDWEYQAKIKLGGGRGQFVDKVIGYWRQHGGGRVGAERFRPDYVQSVMTACNSILQLSRQAGNCDAALENRLAKKLVIHALEWGENGCLPERRECFAQARATTSQDSLMRLAIKCLEYWPSSLDAVLRRAFIRYGAPKSKDRV